MGMAFTKDKLFVDGALMNGYPINYFKDELENRFKVTILKVSTMNFKGKSKSTTMRSGGHTLRSTGKRSRWKKAIITLKQGDKIDLVEGDFNI